MPVAAREASIYTAITVAEYFRDQGLHVALMADSTSRWAEALREVSGRLGELPGEAGYPAYLSSRLAEFYERAARVTTLSGQRRLGDHHRRGEPAGGRLLRARHAHTKRYVRCFWALDRQRAQARFYPAIHPLLSYSADADALADVVEALGQQPRLGAAAPARARRCSKRRRTSSAWRASSAGRAARRSSSSRCCAPTSINDGFLRQSSFSKVDRYCSPARQAAMMLGAARLHGSRRGRRADRRGAVAARRAAGACASCSASARNTARATCASSRNCRTSSTTSSTRCTRWTPMFADLLLEGAVTRIDGPLLFARRAARVGLNYAVEVVGSDGGTRLGRVAALDARVHGHRGAAVHRGPRTAGHAGAPAAGAAAVRRGARPARAHLRQRRPADRRRPARLGAGPHAHRRAGDQPVVARPAPRLHRDRRVDHRPAEQPGARPEAAAVLGGRPAARPPRDADRAARAPARRQSGGVRGGVRRHGRAARHRRAVPPRHGVERRARPHGAVPQPRRRARHAAPAHAALRADGGRVPRLRRGPPRAGGAHRHDQLLRGAARGVGEPRRDPEPQGLPGLHVFRSRGALRARRAASAAGRARSRSCRSSPCRATTSATRSRTSPATSPKARSCSTASSTGTASTRRSRCCRACRA